jgi:hypothetical protein
MHFGRAHGLGRFGLALGTIATLAAVACTPRSGSQPQAAEATTRALGTSPAEWVELGPAPILHNSNAHGIGPNGDGCSGATSTVIVHPTMPNIVYVVPTTGGVWRTTNYGDDVSSLQWKVLTDTMPSSSIGNLAMDPGNPQVLVAGTGAYTDYIDPDGGRVYVTTNGGDSWLEIQDPLLFKKTNIRQVNVHGGRILVGTENNGLFISNTNDVTKPSFAAVNSIPTNATVRSLVSAPSTPSRLFAAIPNAIANNGIYRSEDDGVTWTLLSPPAGGSTGNDEFRSVTQNPNIDTEKLAIGSDGRLYLAVAIYIDQSWVGSSDDHGANWTSIEVPKFPWADPIDIASIGPMVINGQNVVVVTSAVNFDSAHPLQHAVRLTGVSIAELNNHDFLSEPVPGQNLPNVFMITDMLTEKPILSTGQTVSGGKWQPWYSTQHEGQWDKSALGVDPTDSTALYIAGDKVQVRWTPSNKPANQIPTTQWTSIRMFDPGDGATLHDTFPHVDSLALAFDSQARLLLGCDGGVFRHNNPKGMGDWESLNTNLGTTQIHDVSIDPVSGMAFGGLQDNGTVTQMPGAGKSWIEIGGSDGNDTAACGRPDGLASDRYSQLLDVQTMDKTTGQRIGDMRHPDLCVSRAIEGGPCLSKLGDVDGYRLNADKIAINKAALALDPSPDKVHIVFAQGKAVWESMNGGEDVTVLHTLPDVQNLAGNVMNFAYGHSKSVDALWAISGNALFVRLNTGDPLARISTMPVPIQGGRDVDVVMATDDPKHAFVVTQERVFVTTDAGATTTNWKEITGDLSHQSCATTAAPRARRIYAIRYIPSTRGDRLFIGTDRGVFMAAVDNPGVWTQAGSLLPTNMAVADMDYLASGPNASSDTLVAAIYGRGVWRLPNASVLNRAPKMASFPNRNADGLCETTLSVIADASCRADVSPSGFGSGAIDPDGDSVTLSVDKSGPYPLGSTCTTLVASDTNSASAACKVNIVVVDQTPPVINNNNPLPDFTSTTCGALTLPQPVASDNCGGVLTVTSDAPASFPLGVTTVTWTATDTSGNHSPPAKQKVTVGGPPTFTQKPVDKSYTVCDVPPGIGTAKAVDVCGTSVPVTNDAPATFPVGTTTVTWTAKDSAGNVATFPQKITVAAATDLQGEHFISTVKNNACLKVTKYPAWGAYVHALIIQPQATGVGWPIPFTYTNCGTTSGSGSLPGPWQQGTTKPVSALCPTFIKLGANGAGSVALTWWGNG